MVGQENQVQWLPSKTGFFTVRSAYTALQNQVASVNWYKLVLYNGYVPRFAFILWLLCRNRLAPLSRMKEWGTVDNADFMLCVEQTKSEIHLFLKCKAS